MKIKRIGFACKWVELSGKGAESVPELNTRTTTMRWLRENPGQAENKLWELMKHNIYVTQKLVERVGALPNELRMVRISSDLLPGFTEPNWRGFWRRTDVQDYAEKAFRHVGHLARLADVRLSFHPGQFCVLASDKDDVVTRSIEEFEYHATMARWMGFGGSFQDFKINVHISGRAGPEGIRDAYKRLSPEARNCITIENEEMTHGLDDCLTISDLVPIVLDIHHHWVREGEYIQPQDHRVKRVVDSWRGLRPTSRQGLGRQWSSASMMSACRAIGAALRRCV